MNIKNRIALVLCIYTTGLVSCGKKTQETTPIRRDVTETVFAPGVLEADGTYNLTAQMEGYLQEVNFKEGELVARGAVLAIVNNQENILNTQSAEALYEIARANVSPSAPALREAASSITIARERMELDSVQMRRYKRLYEENSIARADYDNALLQYATSKENYRAALEKYRQARQQAEQQLINNETQKQISRLRRDQNKITAQVSGKVYRKYKETGDFVKKGDVIAQIGDAAFIYARVNVDESNIGRIKTGQQALVQLNTNKEKTYRGRVAEIDPAFDEETQSFTCKIYFTDSLDFTVLGTQLQSNIVVDVQKNALLIPRNYLDFGSRVTVKGKKQPVKVTTKFVSSEWVQVLDGIDDKTVLVTDNISEKKPSPGANGIQLH
jgi:HlyD family secretion protein